MARARKAPTKARKTKVIGVSTTQRDRDRMQAYALDVHARTGIEPKPGTAARALLRMGLDSWEQSGKAEGAAT